MLCTYLILLFDMLALLGIIIVSNTLKKTELNTKKFFLCVIRCNACMIFYLDW